MSYSEDRQLEDYYNEMAAEAHYREQEEEMDRLKNDSKRLDWLLSGNGSMKIDINNSLDWCDSRESLDRAIFEDICEVKEAGMFTDEYVKRKTDSYRLDYLLQGNGEMSLFTTEISNMIYFGRTYIDDAMQFEQEQRRIEGKTYFTPCGMMCNPDGSRSIFDGVDQ